MRRPLIGISGRRWPVAWLGDRFPPSFSDAWFDLHLTEYGSAIAAAGGLPIQLTRDAPVSEMIERLDGLVLTGGADVDPGFYDQAPGTHVTHTEPERDEFELALLRAALDAKVPVLAVCRGLQLLNVALGGSLKQHVDKSEGDGHPNFEVHRATMCHPIAIVSGSLTHGLYGGSHNVNSLHHQTIDRLGSDLVVTARSPDSEIEAVELPGHPVLAVQWHPEAQAGPDPSFAWLVSDARVRSTRNGV
jgi:putative glutamine amidotransferase